VENGQQNNNNRAEEYIEKQRDERTGIQKMKK
jgi:hypothetical protein